MDFFSKCETKEEAKKIYRKLAMVFHPDKGGNTELMLELQSQFDSFDPIKNTVKDFDNHFKFNTINRGGNIPFDHPIHEKIRVLEGELSRSRQRGRELQTIVDGNAQYIRDLNAYILAQNKEIDERNNEIDRHKFFIKCYETNSPKTLWEHIKHWIGIKYEKQSKVQEM